MKSLVISIALSAMLFALGSSAEAGQKIFTIGILRSGSPASVAAEHEALLQGLRDLGYHDRKTIKIEYRYAEGKPERWAPLASELVRLNVDVLVVSGVGVTRAARDATRTIPIVVGAAGDLVKSGLIASLAQPGGNITGSTEISTDLSDKRVELLKEVMPHATTLAVIWHSPSGLSDDEEELKQVVSAANQFGIKVLPLGVRSAEEFQDTFNKIIGQKADAVNILRSSLTLFHRGDLARLSIKSRLASICDGLDFAREGCLMAYGADLLHLWRRAAIFIDKILKGAKPADLPVEQPTKFELVINLKTAEALDLTIPPILRYQADKVIQ